MNIWLVKIYSKNQVYLNKLNLKLLHWVKFIIEDYIKKKKKKEGLLKTLKNIEDKNEEQLKTIKN